MASRSSVDPLKPGESRCNFLCDMRTTRLLRSHSSKFSLSSLVAVGGVAQNKQQILARQPRIDRDPGPLNFFFRFQDVGDGVGRGLSWE
ncbi:hypothetical protein BJY01DRAFT_225657 [Aspergillus pseudoustus]|uniref:Uncharacterized protein n=1 Tax=Aspergillus pseudoustus TaxID=1810923 RepID=A0ABR4IYH9_9EURO